MKINFLLLCLLFVALLGFPSKTMAKQVCADLDGDGVAETCVEIDETPSGKEAHFPGSPPPEVPPVGNPVPAD